MKIVIDIPDTQYEYLTKIATVGEEPLGYFERVIMRGTPLPKGHGRLIDADAITKDVKTLQNSFVINMEYMTGKILGCECIAPTIIEGSDSE